MCVYTGKIAPSRKIFEAQNKIVNSLANII